MTGTTKLPAALARAITTAEIDAYHRDGATVIRDVIPDGWINLMRDAVDRILADPGPASLEYTDEGKSGRYYGDFFIWMRDPDFKAFMMESPLPDLAQQVMKASTVNFFYDQLLVKEPNTAEPTPWHQDDPYYFVSGMQNVSFWVPLDPVEEATLRCVAGSHRWEKPVLPTRWLSEENFYPDPDAYLPVPDPDAEGMEIREFAMQPGDALAFHFRCLHGAHGNETSRRRRAFSLRLLGDDACYTERPGRTSPPFPGHGMTQGQRLREDWFPVLYPADQTGSSPSSEMKNQA